ncbi:MAG: MoaD/ThiS family protein [Pseudohongiellaceae bacterium]
MIRVLLPFHLQTLAQCGPNVELEVDAPHTARAVIRTLENRFPTLRGAIIDHYSGERRPKVRFFACKEDISHESMDDLLPAEVINGKESFLIVGAISGG